MENHAQRWGIFSHRTVFDPFSKLLKRLIIVRISAPLDEIYYDHYRPFVLYQLAAIAQIRMKRKGRQIFAMDKVFLRPHLREAIFGSAQNLANSLLRCILREIFARCRSEAGGAA